MSDDLTEKLNEEPVLRGEPSIDFERYDIERCERKNGGCYGCRTLREHVAYACPKVGKALDESVKELGPLIRHPNALVTFGILDE